MAGTIVTDRIESDATYASSIELASPVLVSNTFTTTAGVNTNTLDVTAGVTANTLVVNGNNISATNSMMFRNRIINGDMRIDQRNAGAALTVNALATFFAVDRWYGFGQATDGVYTLQQNTTAPAGFTNSIKATVTTADASLSATNVYGIQQRIEGFNVADLGWGTANAQPITVSFWVQSSVTGSFGARVANGAANRSYPFSYTISAANTWEYKTVTIPGDTTGTWLTTNGIGISLIFSLGVGSNFTGTADTWAAADYIAPTGSVNLMATLNATFYLTGVQLEAGSVATPFERRPYGTELALCQRYYARTSAYSGLTGTGAELSGVVYGSVPMRAAPTLTAVVQEGGPTALSGLDQPNNNTNAICRWWVNSGSKGSPGYIIWNGTASAEL